MVREFERRDQHAVAGLIRAGMYDRWRELYDSSANPDVDDMWASYVANGGEVVVWEEDGAVVGTGTLVLEPDGGGRIMRMSVERTFRRRGLGRKIVGRNRAAVGFGTSQSATLGDHSKRYRVCAKTPFANASTFTGATSKTIASPPSWWNIPSPTVKSQSPWYLLRHRSARVRRRP